MWIIFGAKMFATVFIMVGTARLISEGLMGLAIPPIALVLMMQFSYILLGCITEEVTMIALTIPIYAPILTALGFDPVWFGVLFLVNLQMGYLTPPFGYCLFYMKGVAPPEVSTVDLYHSIWPFLVIQLCVLMLVLFLPQLALWLPETVFGLK
jgi:TRAP-type mannitol/chloroaromatic compound transport system permease large subunit